MENITGKREKQMRATGIVRKIDYLGRIVIPKELRRSMELPEGVPMEIFVDGRNIILRKYSPREMTKEDILLAALQMACKEAGKDPVDYLNKVREGLPL